MVENNNIALLPYDVGFSITPLIALLALTHRNENITLVSAYCAAGSGNTVPLIAAFILKNRKKS
jgi:hypothetical protein